MVSLYFKNRKRQYMQKNNNTNKRKKQSYKKSIHKKLNLLNLKNI